MMLPRRIAVLLVAAAAFVSAAPRVEAQDYPSRPIKLVIPFTPGGASDVLGRITADSLSTQLGQRVFVENKPGAGSTIGADYVAKSAPDGYTLLWCPSDSASVAAALKPNLPYKIPGDFAFIAQVAAVPNIIVVNSKLPIHNVKELIAYAKANPGKLRYGSSGVGSILHLSAALFANEAGIDMLHVPFNGAAPAITALLGGFIDVFFGAPSPLLPYVKNGEMRALATTGPKRSPDMPDLPTVAESGLPNDVVVVWWGLVAPAGTPKPIQTKLAAAVQQMMKDPAVLEKFKKMGVDAYFSNGAEFESFVVKETAQWKNVAEKANIKLQQ